MRFHRFARAALAALAALAVIALAVAVAELIDLVATEPADAQTLRPLASDQPGKASNPGTVDRGHSQIEATPADWTQGAGTVLGATVFKYGVTSFADLEVAVTPCAAAWACEWGGTTVRAKVAFLPEDGALTGAVISGIVVNPGQLVQGSIAVPMAYKVNSVVGVDMTATVTGAYDATFQFAAGVNIGLTSTVTLSLEGWTSTSAHLKQETGDVALAWQPGPNDQWSVGGNFGVPTAEVYLGYVRRF
jgi:hypothetical protein